MIQIYKFYIDYFFIQDYLKFSRKSCVQNLVQTTRTGCSPEPVLIDITLEQLFSRTNSGTAEDYRNWLFPRIGSDMDTRYGAPEPVPCMLLCFFFTSCKTTGSVNVTTSDFVFCFQFQCAGFVARLCSSVALKNSCLELSTCYSIFKSCYCAYKAALFNVIIIVVDYQQIISSKFKYLKLAFLLSCYLVIMLYVQVMILNSLSFD